MFGSNPISPNTGDGWRAVHFSPLIDFQTEKIIKKISSAQSSYKTQFVEEPTCKIAASHFIPARAPLNAKSVCALKDSSLGLNADDRLNGKEYLCLSGGLLPMGRSRSCHQTDTQRHSPVKLPHSKPVRLSAADAFVCLQHMFSPNCARVCAFMKRTHLCVRETYSHQGRCKADHFIFFCARMFLTADKQA